MKRADCRNLFVLLLAVLISSVILMASGKPTTANKFADSVPRFQVDPFWPKPLPNNWLLGQVAGIAVDSKDHVWIVQRPGSLDKDEAAAAQVPPVAQCCIPAPPVIEFDREGNVVQAWGGTGGAFGAGQGYKWPANEHGIFVDHEDNVWIAGIDSSDHYVLKFKQDGTFLLQIGKAGETGGSNDTNLLGRPAEFDVDPAADEVYIADGYLNRRIIVFDAKTGEYKRHWGAYGSRPDDSPLKPYDPGAPPSRHFRTASPSSAMHAVRLSKDGLVYACDRENDRIQVFQKDGRFVKEAFVAKNTLGNGTVWDLDFSPDPKQTFVYVADGTNQCVWILSRADLTTAGSFGRSGRNAGQFHWVHSLAVDSKGNIYTSEVQNSKRVQKFICQ